VVGGGCGWLWLAGSGRGWPAGRCYAWLWPAGCGCMRATNIDKMVVLLFLPLEGDAGLMLPWWWGRRLMGACWCCCGGTSGFAELLQAKVSWLRWGAGSCHWPRVCGRNGVPRKSLHCRWQWWRRPSRRLFLC
jgi:hypothetical protein